jgi:hypothetical protein
VIERLNFYDVYGYLLPGLGLLGVIWFPFWFVAHYELPAAWSSALVILVLGYLAGHALAPLSRLAFPHGRVLPATQGPGTATPASKGPAILKRRAPSDYLLDRSDPTIAESVKRALGELIHRRFGIDVLGPAEMPMEPDKRERAEAELTRRRTTAFMLCRRALLQHKVGSYAEQFEGLYALMRGWTTVAWMSVVYHLGWIGGRSIPDLVPVWTAEAGLAAAGAAVIAYGIHDYRRERDVRRLRRPPVLYDPWGFRLVTLALFFFGALVETQVRPASALQWSTVYTLAGVAAISGVLALRFHSVYHYFAGSFAETVYRDFYSLERYQPGTESAGATRRER